MVAVEGIADWIGREVVDRSGEKVGKLADVYYDTTDDEPRFIAVKSGAFGRSLSVAPLAGATLSRDFVRLDAPKGLIKDAPSEDAGGRLTGLDALAVLKHFGLPREPDLEGEERVCFQTTGAAEETERKRDEVAAEERASAAAGATASSAAAATPEPTPERGPAASLGGQDAAEPEPVAAAPASAPPAEPEPVSATPGPLRLAEPEPAAGSVVVGALPADPAPEPERDLPAEPTAPETADPVAAAPASAIVPPQELAPDDDDPLARLAALERRVSALEAKG